MVRSEFRAWPPCAGVIRQGCSCSYSKLQVANWIKTLVPELAMAVEPLRKKQEASSNNLR